MPVVLILADLLRLCESLYNLTAMKVKSPVTYTSLHIDRLAVGTGFCY